jgi:transcriptional regulator with XRE-family HTH domain
MPLNNNILSLINSYYVESAADVAREIAADFRRRRVEKNLTRDDVASLSGVAVSNIVRFERTGLISLINLIGIAKALNYTAEVRGIFSEQKYSTMNELQQIRGKQGHIRASGRKTQKSETYENEKN